MNVGIAEAEVLADYETNRKFYLILAVAMTGVLLVVTALIVLRQVRPGRSGDLLRASEAAYAQKSQLLETMLEHMSQGILMVDAAYRVQVCNRWVIDKFGPPEALMADSPDYDDVLIWQWRQGESGDSIG